MKKAVLHLGFVSVFMLIWHSVLTVQYYSGGLPYSAAFRVTGAMLAAAAAVHGAISVVQMVKNVRKMKGHRYYSKLITDGTAQNTTGLFVVGFLIIHAVCVELNLAFDIRGLRILQLVFDIAFYASVCLHLCITMPHMLISYGMVTRKSVYTVLRAVICAVFLVFLAVLIRAETIFMLA